LEEWTLNISISTTVRNMVR